MIDRLADAGIPVDRSCRVLGVARQNYYKAKRKPTTPTELRRRWLTGVIREVHVASRGTYGYRRVHAELTLGMDITVCERTVWSLVNQAGLYGLPGPLRVKRLRGVVTADDLVNRKFHRIRPNELWVTDITQHRTREGWLYCAAVLDAFSRRIVGWRVASNMRTDMVLDALEMARRSRGARRFVGLIAHADAGSQFTSVRFTERLDEIGARPSIGTVADSYDNALAETTNGLYKAECVRGPDAPTVWEDVDELELATLSWVHWFNHDRLHGHCGHVPPAEFEAAFYAADQTDPTGVGIQ